ncbi:hypothetical protein [Clostridium tunisiense]|uniref:hypothetical protein n=1 Tax=Clostridium tunisiense TaxID=219748 RepID=UPI0012FE54E1|nr:hypothetical protein [Clostridium tunisiense]
MIENKILLSSHKGKSLDKMKIALTVRNSIYEEALSQLFKTVSKREGGVIIKPSYVGN